MQATLRLKNFASLNLTDLLPAGVTFTDPQFFRNAVSNVTSATSVQLSSNILPNSALLHRYRLLSYQWPWGMVCIWHGRLEEQMAIELLLRFTRSVRLERHATVMIVPNRCHGLLQGFTIASAFLNYAPCLVGSFPAGVQITAAGIEFSPTGKLLNHNLGQ